MNIHTATRDFLDHQYASAIQDSHSKILKDIDEEGSGRPINYEDLPELEEAARFIRFHLDVPFGLAQIKQYGRAEARIAKNSKNHWNIYKINGDPYFGVVLHKALSSALSEKQVQNALNITKYHTVLVHLKFIKTNDHIAVDRNLPLYYVDKHIIKLSAFHVERVECIEQKQLNCDNEIRDLEQSKIFRRLLRR